MNEFERFLNKAKDVTELALSKTEEMVDKGRAKLDIKKAEHDIKKIYEKIGKTVYEEALAGADVSEEVSSYVSEIDTLKERIADIESEIL